MKKHLMEFLARLQAFGTRRWMELALAGLVLLLALQGLRFRRLGHLENKVLAALTQAETPPPKREGTKELKDYEETGTLCRGGPKPAKNKEKGQFWGILGNEVLYGSSSNDAKLYKVGESLPDGDKILRIGANDVLLEKDGKERTEYIFNELKPKTPPAPKPEKDEKKPSENQEVKGEKK